jgi:tetratricopeptide (TPR) repeat protein
MRRELVLVALAASAALAVAKPDNVTDGELALTPPYCPDTMGFKYGDAYYNTSPRAGHWVGLMGKNFWSLHHYCWAMINLRRAQMAGVPPMTRKGLLENVVSDCIYVVKNTAPDFVLLPEIHTRIGETQLLLNNTGAAYDSFAQARALKPDYWPAYLRWAEVLVKINQKGEAKKLIAEGLRHAPDAKPLIDEYRLLGGDPTSIRPISKETKPADGGAAAPAASAASATAS